MDVGRGWFAFVAGALSVGLLVGGCGPAQNELRVTPDSDSSSEGPSGWSHQPIPSELPDPVAGSPRPILMQDARAPVADDLERLAESFVGYAVGDSKTFPHGESVSMSLGGEQVVSVDDIAAALSMRRIWRICPADWELFGASSCPVDLLGPIVSAGVNTAPLVYSGEYGDVVCAPPRTGPVPSGRLVVLRPVPEWRTCASDFALALAADEQGRLRSIDLTLSDP